MRNSKIGEIDHLYVKEPQITEPSAVDSPASEGKPSSMEEKTDMDHIPDVMEETAYLATSSAALPPIVLSHNLDTLWNNLDHSACNHPLIHIFGLHPHLLWSAMHCIMPFLKSKKIFARILKKWDSKPFVPNRRFRIKIARLLVKHRLVSAHLLRNGAQTITANFIDAQSNVSCYLKGVPYVCCADSGAHNSILSDETFRELKLDPNKLDKRQIFNIRTATAT